MSDGAATWLRACRAADCLRTAPRALGGIWLRARPGPARDAFLARLADLDPVRIHPQMDRAALVGGIDITASLASGRAVHRPGLLRSGRPLLVPMAERLESALAADLARALDDGCASVIAIDEGVDDEILCDAVADRLGLFVTLDGVSARDASAPGPDGPLVVRDEVSSQDPLRDLAHVSAQLGIGSLRAPLLAFRCAQTLARIDGLPTQGPLALAEAVGLSLAHRARASDAAPIEPEMDDTDPRETGDADGPRSDEVDRSGENLIRAARGELDDDVLAALSRGRQMHNRSTGKTGQRRVGTFRGRPLPARAGPATSGDIDLVATLSAAVPWQTLRGRTGPGERLRFSPGDLHRRRTAEGTERLVIFVVDMSGSSASARLAEAKGAIAGILTRNYAARDRVAVIVFRQAGARMAVPPTRSLGRVRACLAECPAGGPTPLAHALIETRKCLSDARRAGLTPHFVVWTDGRGNVALDGRLDRAAARDDAIAAARGISALGCTGHVVDLSRRAGSSARALADALDCPLADMSALPQLERSGPSP